MESTFVGRDLVSGLSSGANASGTNPGGSTKSSYCLRSTLSIANSFGAACTGSYVGSIGSSSRINSTTSSTKSRFEGLAAKNITNATNVSEPPYSVSSGTYILSDKNRDITISHNIVLEEEKTYNNLDEIPKVIIYGKNINIDCGVTRIDAVLIAEGTVNTCSNGGTITNAGSKRVINAKQNSNQLVINGAIITGNLQLNRTYGAATGSNSIVPAELINYDASLYLWGASKADVTNSGELTETYRHETAPRY